MVLKEQEDGTQMGKIKGKFRAIDLYSGIGGWSLGLEMAGIDVVASYEWWNKANQTNHKNNKHIAIEIDIRQLNLQDIPKDIDIVVGSPPCTQFSFANRGGSGDIEDGLKDISKFLEVVSIVRPKFWAMENVPRVASIVELEMKEGGRLEKFSHLKPNIQIIDTCNWGVPQRRQRCIVGNFDMALLNSYRSQLVQRTLGDVVASLSQPIIIDPNYGIQHASDQLKDHLVEDVLSPEEERMNREMKTFHPVYNNMAFPDPLSRTARTITATCTRVSRESVIIEAPEHPGRFRRLSVRERGCLQGFPITYQFFGSSHAQKLKMIGNAVPPLFTFYVAQAMLGVKPQQLISPQKGIEVFSGTQEVPAQTLPDTAGDSYSAIRKFRAAIPNLRFKSGVRFELSNSFASGNVSWSVKFFYGNSKNISELHLNEELFLMLKGLHEIKAVFCCAERSMQPVKTIVESTDARSLQQVWMHSINLGCHPYEIVDSIGRATAEVIAQLSISDINSASIIEAILTKQGSPLGTSKVLKHAEAVLAGVIVGSMVNAYFECDLFKSMNAE